MAGRKRVLDNYTMIKVNVETAEMLRGLKVSTETYDQVIRRLAGRDGVNVYFDILSVDGDERVYRHEVVFRLGDVCYKYRNGKFYVATSGVDGWRRARWVEV